MLYPQVRVSVAAFQSCDAKLLISMASASAIAQGSPASWREISSGLCRSAGRSFDVWGARAETRSRRGGEHLAKASARGLGPYGLQAAIAAAHASAPSVEATDRDRIVVLYEALGRVAPSPVVELNRAVAVAMASGPAQALAIVDELIALDRLPGSHLVPTVRGELLARLGRRPEARAELELAARLCANQRERSVLLRKAAALDL
jgi:predicted RNA polymerase sigma factor